MSTTASPLARTDASADHEGLRAGPHRHEGFADLVVLGAAGRTGHLVVEQALAAGHSVTALVRSPQKGTLRHPKLRVVVGDATDPTALSRALAGADAVISTLGSRRSVIADSSRALVAAAHEAGVNRVVILSSWLVQRDQMLAVTRVLTGIAMGSVITDKVAGEQLIRDSDLDWTIVYPGMLTDGPAVGSVVLPDGATRGISDRISRADVAAWLVRAAARSQHIGQRVGITGFAETHRRLPTEAANHA
jgi:putative NADH-flavin reductase